MAISIRQRSVKSQLLLVLSFSTSIAMFLFAIYRISVEQWPIALVDLFVSIAMAIIFICVYKTDNVKKISLITILLGLISNIISFYLIGISQIGWIYPIMLLVYYSMEPKKCMVLNLFILMLYIPKLIITLPVVDFLTMISTIVFTNGIAYFFAEGLTKQACTLKKLASVDYLTQTGNRMALDEDLQQLHKQLKNHDKTASLVLIDLDYFKKINDNYGHIKGDQVLVDLSMMMMNSYEHLGKVYRYGGEEFMVVCAYVDVKRIIEVSEDFRKSVKNNIVIHDEQLSLSLGLTEYVKEESIEEWVHRVDLALYQAKKGGRDRLIKA